MFHTELSDAVQVRRGLAKRLTQAALVWAALLVAAPATSFAANNAHPNIVFILADDMGYGDVQALNPKSQIPTPNLNRLAEEGMTFTDAHTPSAVCTPTRYGLLTGRYCWRSSLKSGVLNGYSGPLIETRRATVASFLKAQGYSTGIVGKWHLGLGWVKEDGAAETINFERPVTHGPNTLGFDYSYIIPASLDFPPYVYLQNHRVTEPTVGEQKGEPFPAFLRKGPRANDLVMEEVLDHLLDRASSFIKREATSDKPFFLYFPLTAPHKPVLPHPRFRGTTKLGPYGDFVAQVDATVGGVLQAIDDAGAKENTLVIYTSDNGSFMYRQGAGKPDHVAEETVQGYAAENHTSNHVFRGTKADIWEGGHHVPFFARWPARVRAGSRCESTLCLTDFFATAAHIVGKETAVEDAPDSCSFLAALSGNEWSRPVPVIHHSANGVFAIRQGPWKLVAGNGSGGRENPRGKPFERPYQLYNLGEDIRERANQIEQHAGVAADLEAELDTLRQH